MDLFKASELARLPGLLLLAYIAYVIGRRAQVFDQLVADVALLKSIVLNKTKGESK